MRKILLNLSFTGTAYHGWQVQKNAVTVQKTVQDALEKIFENRPGLTGCSRTDSGVHALNYYCAFETEKTLALHQINRALNANLPYDIAVKGCSEVPLNFHPRYAALKKEYNYLIWNRPYKNPFLQNRAYHYVSPLSLPLLNQTAAVFVGRHDFQAFSAVKEKKDTVREIYRFEAEEEKGLIKIAVEGNGFLYHMVRILAGALLAVQEGRLNIDEIPLCFQREVRNKSICTLPAYGLYLKNVYYAG